MKQPKQLGFKILEENNSKIFGGAYLKRSHAKTRRPISAKRPMHVVLRATLARGRFSLLKRENEIRALISRQGKLHGVKVYRQANGGNHIHLIILPASRKAFKDFIRAISGLIARRVTGSQRGRSNDFRFWDQRPFSRILEWGRDFNSTCHYLLRNILEAYGFIPYRPRKSFVCAPGARPVETG